MTHRTQTGTKSPLFEETVKKGMASLRETEQQQWEKRAVARFIFRERRRVTRGDAPYFPRIFPSFRRRRRLGRLLWWLRIIATPISPKFTIFSKVGCDVVAV